MNTSEVAIVRGWLKANRGAQTQEDLAAAITAATGWNITRDRYSKYESGPLPIGPKVLAHFVDYWKSLGRPGPDFAPPVTAPAPDLASAITALIAALDADREERLALTRAIAALAQSLATLQGAEALRVQLVPRGSAG